MRILLIILATLVLTGCATKKRCSRKFPPVEKIEYIEITNTVEKWRDTTIYKDLPPIEIEKFVPVKDTLILKASYSEAQCWVIDSMLVGNIKEGTAPVKIEYKIKEIVVEKIVYDHKEITVQVRYIPNWAKVLIIIGFVSLLYVIFRIIFALK